MCSALPCSIVATAHRCRRRHCRHRRCQSSEVCASSLSIVGTIISWCRGFCCQPSPLSIYSAGSRLYHQFLAPGLNTISSGLHYQPPPPATATSPLPPPVHSTTSPPPLVTLHQSSATTSSAASQLCYLPSVTSATSHHTSPVNPTTTPAFTTSRPRHDSTIYPPPPVSPPWQPSVSRLTRSSLPTSCCIHAPLPWPPVISAATLSAASRPHASLPPRTSVDTS